MLDGIFLRGDEAAILNDPEFLQTAEDRQTHDKNSFGPGYTTMKNLGVYEGAIRYDGYVALARHAFEKLPGEPLTFLAGDDPVKLSTLHF